MKKRSYFGSRTYLLLLLQLLQSTFENMPEEGGSFRRKKARRNFENSTAASGARTHTSLPLQLRLQRRLGIERRTSSWGSGGGSSGKTGRFVIGAGRDRPDPPRPPSAVPTKCVRRSLSFLPPPESVLSLSEYNEKKWGRRRKG